MKKSYSPPRLTVFGSVEELTRGPIKPSTADNPSGQGDNPNIGCGGSNPCPGS